MVEALPQEVLEEAEVLLQQHREAGISGSPEATAALRALLESHGIKWLEEFCESESSECPL